MQITASALSLNVADPSASAAFAIEHLGFSEEMAADGFVSLAREDAGFNLVFLRTGWRLQARERCGAATPTACSSRSSSTTSTPSTSASSARAWRSRRRSRPSRGASATSR